MFCDLCDYTRLSELCDPEETAALRRQIVSQATRVVLSHRGAITQCYGDGMLAGFGIEESSEDDTRRSIDAALELRQLTRDLAAQISLPADFELRMHFGLHSGLVFVQSGDEVYGRYDLAGDAVNVTARLCALAKRDEILVSATALQGIEPFYDAEAVPDLVLKGKSAPLHAFRVHANSSIHTRFEAHSRRGLTRFVGRTSELEQLNGVLRELAPGSVQAVSVVGNAGIGKTRLIEEFVMRCAESDAEIYRGSCENYRKLSPLQPFVQMLQQLFGIRNHMTAEQASSVVLAFLNGRGEHLSRHAEALLLLLSLREPTQATDTLRMQRAILTALSEVFACLDSSKPLLLVIDDWQWADDLSHEVLRIVMRSIATRGLLVLLSTRQHDPGDVVLSRAQSIELRPFHHLETAQVLHTLRPDLLDVGLSRAIHRRSGGNPLFLEELCRTLPIEASLSAESFDDSAVPQSIAAVICMRLELLAPQALRLLRTAAVIGNAFNTQLLALVSGFPELGAALECLVQFDLVRRTEPDGSVYRFKHGITREVVYESVRLAERYRLHGMIVLLLEAHSAASDGGDEFEALAFHCAGSGDHLRAAYYAELSGDKAVTASSLDNARQHDAMALSELDKLPMDAQLKQLWLKLSAKLGRVLVYNAKPAQLKLVERAAQYAHELGDVRALADALQLCAFISYGLGDYRAAIAHAREGLVVAERASDDKVATQLVSNLGQSLAASGQYPEALEHLERSLQLKRQRVAARPDRPLPIGFAYSLSCKALLHADQGDFHLASIELDDAHRLMLRTGHAVEGSVLGLLAMTQIWHGDWEQCVLTAGRAAETAERVTFTYVFAMSQTMNGYARFMLNASPEAVHEVQRAVDWIELHERFLFVSFCYGCLAEILSYSGESELALRYAGRALQRAREHADPLGEAVAHRVLAREYARANDAASANAALADAYQAGVARNSRREFALTKLLESQLLYASGERAALKPTLAQLRLDFDGMGMSWHRAQVDTLLAGC
jgi:class 3 adenylate cyclase/tetratricopeptide (TPR) repeat protein